MQSYARRSDLEIPTLFASLVLATLSLLVGHLIGKSACSGYVILSSPSFLSALFLILGLVLSSLSIVGRRRYQVLAWAALPAIVLLTNAFIFRFYALGNWAIWSSRWPCVPLGMGLGFYAVYALGQRRRYVLLSASTLTALGLWVQAFLLAFREELIYGRVEVPALMYLLGTALIVFNLVVARRN